MWDYDGLIGKARVYFERAEAVGKADDDAFAIWLLLGLEFLLRAPLSRVHPALLADPNGDAILHAVGYPGGSEGRDPKSIQVTTVITRLRRIVEDFTSDRENDATLLAALRNRELHSSEAALASIEVALWLPRFTRVAEVICSHLGLDPTDVVGEQVMKHGRALVDAEDKKLANEVRVRIAQATAFASGLTAEEKADRHTRSPFAPPWSTAKVACPGCAFDVALELETIRRTNERLEDGDILTDVISVARKLRCPVCGLNLDSTAEISAAGLPQQHTSTESESLADRYLSDFEPDDYGND
ncbi:hypothetical protein [Kribbella sp. NPDC049584]|uniref:hypothetical protein n=1 Tax=Kribbella sp. NPDC049584 TaxID=3154833 RepID=UPI00341A57EA